MTTKPRGGTRPGAGAPRLVPGQTTESVQVRLDPARKAKALAIGDGNVAKGKFGAELPSTGPWVIEKIGVSEWFE